MALLPRYSRRMRHSPARTARWTKRSLPTLPQCCRFAVGAVTGWWFLAGVLLAPLAADVLSLDGLVRACSAAFVAVYVTATAAGVRLLSGAARRAAAVACAAVLVVLAFSGPYLAVPAAIALVGASLRRRRTPSPACEQVSAAAS